MAPTALLDGASLALYVAGITYLARGESLPGQESPRWPWLLLVAPVLGWVFVVSHVADRARLHGLLLLPFGYQMWQTWRQTMRSQPDGCRGRPPVGSLLAGIALVDLMLSPSLKTSHLLAFAGLFLAARLFQRVIPAT